jgi:hypothetical protein
LQRRRAHALSLGAFGRRPELVRRVYSILARKQVLHPMAARALVGVAGCSLLIAAVELARCPQVVAFVPAAKTAKMQTQLARAVSSFRVVETKAVLPAGHEIAASTPVAAHRTVAKLTEPTDAPQSQVAFVDHAAPREVMTRAEMPDVGSDPAGQPEYVELTTWEEVRTSHCHHRLTSDYGTDANAQRQSAEATDPAGRRTVTRITVTRLIIAVYPMSSAPGSTPAHAEDDDRLPAPQPESSWLVFKL